MIVVCVCKCTGVSTVMIRDRESTIICLFDVCSPKRRCKEN